MKPPSKRFNVNQVSSLAMNLVGGYDIYKKLTKKQCPQIDNIWQGMRAMRASLHLCVL